MICSPCTTEVVNSVKFAGCGDAPIGVPAEPQTFAAECGIARKRRWGLSCWLGLSLVWLCSMIGQAGDWSQILGNNRDGQAAKGELLPESLPASGPKQVWVKEVGGGYAGPAIVGEQVYLFHRVGDDEVVSCWNANDGATVWETKLPAAYQGGIDSDVGPRCVPTINGDDVIVYGAAGQLSCLSKSDGKTKWTVPLRKQLKAEDGYFGAGSTPLVLKDRVIVNVGSRQAGIVAIDRSSGQLLWKATAHDASYSSPISIDYQGAPLVVMVTRLKLVGIRPNNGEVVFEIPFGMRGPTVNAATPILLSEQRLLLTASYGIGTLVLDLQTNPPGVVLRDDSLLASQYVTPLQIGDLIFAVDGREDMGNGSLCCIDLKAEKFLWKYDELGIAHLIGVGDKLLSVGNRGEVNIVKASSVEYEKLASFALPAGTYRALPAFADGNLWVRSNDGSGGGKLMGFVLKN
jgi:outer membrane protein assembly factor BamB